TVQGEIGTAWKHTLFQPAFLTAKPYPVVHIAMTIFRGSSEDVEFNSVQQFHELYGKTLPEQNHFVPVTADGADSAHEHAERRFHDAMSMAFDKLESATTGLKKAAEDCKKAETKRKKSLAERALES
ncbi:unnamed protein product, partial [Sphacelaria rigidula]